MAQRESEHDTKQRCLCEKYFEDNNKPIFCRNCKSIRCDDCWKHGTCPMCFLGYPKKIVYYRYLKDDNDRGCPICMEEYQNTTWMTTGCGHSICYSCYSQMLQSQKNSNYYDMFCLHNDLGLDNPYITNNNNLITSCPSCNQRVTCCIMNYGGTSRFLDKTKQRIYQWDLYPLYSHLLNQGMFPRKELIQVRKSFIVNSKLLLTVVYSRQCNSIVFSSKLKLTLMILKLKYYHHLQLLMLFGMHIF